MPHRLSSVFLLMAGMFPAGRSLAICVCCGTALLCNCICVCVCVWLWETVKQPSSRITAAWLWHLFFAMKESRCCGCWVARLRRGSFYWVTAEQCWVQSGWGSGAGVFGGTVGRRANGGRASGTRCDRLLHVLIYIVGHDGSPGVRGRRMNSTGGERQGHSSGFVS